MILSKIEFSRDFLENQKIFQNPQIKYNGVVHVLPDKVMELLLFMFYRTCLVNTYVYCTLLY